MWDGDGVRGGLAQTAQPAVRATGAWVPEVHLRPCLQPPHWLSKGAGEGLGLPWAIGDCPLTRTESSHLWS